MPFKEVTVPGESRSLSRRVNAAGRLAALVLVGAIPAAFLAGCGKGEPEYYEVKEVKEAPEAEAAEHDHVHAQMPAATEAQPGIGIQYAIPEGWSEKVPGRMVLKSFQAGTPPEAVADVNISVFPGDVGGQLANVNRWRNQLGLPPVTEAELPALVTDLKVAGMDCWQVDLASAPEMAVHDTTARMVVTAIPHAGQTWFIKMMGIEGAVAGQLESYQAFIQSIRF